MAVLNGSDVMAYLKKQLPEETLKESVLGRIAEAFQSEKEMNEKKEESKMWKMHEKMISTAENIPFTKFKKLFEKFLKGKGKILEVQDLKEEEYFIRFKLDKFKTSKNLLFDIGKGAHGDYVKLPDFSLPEDMTTADK